MAGKVTPAAATLDPPAPTKPVGARVQIGGSNSEKSKVKNFAESAPRVSEGKTTDQFEMSDISLNPGHNFQRKASYDYGTPMAIAQDWKRWMMATHPRAHDNLLDVLLAHKYRLSLRSAPNQSSFRVVAVVFFSRNQREERFHVVGTNDEPSAISGSICAERAALMQLRFVLDLQEVIKVVICTDEVDPISPGMLCREFMASFKQMSEKTPIILGRAVCKKCGLNLSGKSCADVNGEFDANNLEDIHGKIFDECGTKKGSKYPTPHDFVGSITSLRDLFPYPSLYTGLSSVDAFKAGQSYAASKPLPRHNPNAPPLTSSVRSTRTIDSTVGSYRQERFDLSMISALSNDDPTSPAAKTPSRTPGSFTASLRTTVDLMRQIQEDGDENQGETGLNEMTPGIMDHLTSKVLRVSPRLKPSQRREKLLRLATEATTMEIPQRRIHPIRYGAAVLFSDNTVAIASQKVALEYGCTLDAVGQLASAIEKKHIHADEGSPIVKPVLICQCDQFGIAHAPFAQGRSFLTERGYGDCKVLIHQKRPPKKSRDVDADESLTELRLVEVQARCVCVCSPFYLQEKSCL
jgi:cytidine deaminase